MDIMNTLNGIILWGIIVTLGVRILVALRKDIETTLK